MSYALKSFAKTAVSKTASAIANQRYHNAHAKQARKLLKGIEAKKGPTNPLLIKTSDEYARNVLGWGGYAPWLYVYSALAGKFKEGWIPDNYYGAVVVPKMSNKYGDISDLKTLSKLIYRSDLFPDIAYFINGLFFDSCFKFVDKNDLENILFANSDIVVFKADGSEQGKEIYFFRRSTFALTQISRLSNGVFQKYIVQHALMEKFMPSSVATLRITTAIDNKADCSVRASYLRLGRATDTHVKSSTNINVPIDRNSGEFSEVGYLKSWLTTDEHPDSRIKFAGNFVPAYDKCVAAVLDLHKALPIVRCIGWDVSVTKESEVNIIEWNGGHNDIKFTEVTQGPCFADLKWEELWRK